MSRKPSPDVLDRIDRIRVVSWEWNEAAADVGLPLGQRAIGVIAQELALIFPELVSTADDGYQQVDYGPLASIAIAGIQQIRRELEAVRAQLGRRRRPVRRGAKRRRR